MSNADKGKANAAALHRMIDSIAETIEPIVVAHAESEVAHADKLEAQVALVAAILALAQPAVRALGTRPKISEIQTDGDASVDQLASWRGLVLTHPVKKKRPYDEPEPMQITTQAGGRNDDGSYVYSKGSFGGSHVFLREDGSLAELSYEGTWHCVRGGQTEWRATEREISAEVFCRDWPAAADPRKLAEQLLGFMDTAGDRSKATAKAHDLADKYRAIAALL